MSWFYSLEQGGFPVKLLVQSFLSPLILVVVFVIVLSTLSYRNKWEYIFSYCSYWVKGPSSSLISGCIHSNKWYQRFDSREKFMRGMMSPMNMKKVNISQDILLTVSSINTGRIGWETISWLMTLKYGMWYVKVIMCQLWRLKMERSQESYLKLDKNIMIPTDNYSRKITKQGIYWCVVLL